MWAGLMALSQSIMDDERMAENMKRITTLTIFLTLLFVFSILMLFFGIPKITGNSLVLLDSLSPMIASIILAAFSGIGLLIILNKRV